MITIRPAHTADAEQLRQPYVSVIAEQLDYILQNPNPTLAEEEAFIDSTFAAGGVILVAENKQGQLLAMLTLNRQQHPQLKHRASFGLSVGREYRGRSLGRQLIEQALIWCQTNGVIQLSLEVVQHNPAVRLYQRLGFEVVGTNPMGMSIDSRLYGVITMATVVPKST